MFVATTTATTTASSTGIHMHINAFLQHFIHQQRWATAPFPFSFCRQGDFHHGRGTDGWASVGGGGGQTGPLQFTGNFFLFLFQQPQGFDLLMNGLFVVQMQGTYKTAE